MKQIPVFPKASDTRSKIGRRGPQGIAHILRDRDDMSDLFETMADGGRSPDVNESHSIPHIELFYNLEEIFSQMSHEGRNYMSPILGYASLIGDSADKSSPEYKWAGKLISSLHAMERYFGQLDIYRMKGTAQVSAVEWGAFLDEVLEFFLKLHNKQTQIDISNHVQGRVVLNTELLKRVLFHILKNACESMEKNGTIHIEACAGDGYGEGADDEKCITVTVTDEGCGISQSKLDYIWNPFFTTKSNRFGLGLSYVSMAAAILRMDVDLRSDVGKGSSFALKLKTKGDHIGTAKSLGR